MYDVNKDNMICKKELENLIKLLEDGDDTPAEEIKNITGMILNTFDEDGDGKLSYEEFYKFMEDTYDSD